MKPLQFPARQFILMLTHHVLQTDYSVLLLRCVYPGTKVRVMHSVERQLVCLRHVAPLFRGLTRPGVIVCRGAIDGMGQATPSATYFSCMLSSQATCVIVSGLRAALDLDTYPLSNLIRPRCAERAKPGRGKPVLIMHIGFFTCFHAISPERSGFSKIATLFFLLL